MNGERGSIWGEEKRGFAYLTQHFMFGDDLIPTIVDYICYITI